MKKSKYYAFCLRDGSHGVVSTWKICQMIVNKQSHARYRKFEDREEAYEWIKEVIPSKGKKKRLKQASYNEFKSKRKEKLDTLYDKDLKPGKKINESSSLEAKRQSMKLDPREL